MSHPLITQPTFEHHHDGMGVENSRPRISWRFEANSSTVNAWIQTSYELEITLRSDDKPQIFHVESEQSVLVPWPSRPLSSRETATVRVRVFGKSLSDEAFNGTEPSPWSPPAAVEISLLSAADFKANFIAPAQQIGPSGPLRPVRFRKEFTLPPTSVSGLQARLYITALGVFEAWINGNRVSDECLAPGWTSYKFRLIYRTLDVTSLLRPGQLNVICAEVGEGWYAGRLGFKGGKRFRYGSEIGLFAQLEVRGSDGLSWDLISDDSWTAGPSAITNSELYDGETYDLREEHEDWRKKNSNWAGGGTKILPRPSATLVAPDAAPVRVIEKLPCEKVFKSKSGKTILDFGQNLVGKLNITNLNLERGKQVTFRHAEVMENGELGTRPLRQSKCLDTIIGSGQLIQEWCPKFTFHGFRYVQVDGWPDDDSLKDKIQALVTHTDMRRRGTFECSNMAVNKLHRNVVWSMRGNFLSIPTDCPQRDERLGWTGDLQVFCPTASFLYDTMGILGNWLQDVAAEQLEEGKGGIPPLVVPNAISSNWPHIAQAVWDDVTVLTPDVLYQYSSDKNLLERQFESMQVWLDEGVDRAEDGLWNPDRWQLADWLDPSAPPEDPGNGRTNSILVANAYLIHTTETFARLCAQLGKKDLASSHGATAEKLKALFQRRYITPDGNLMSDSQTGLALAIQFDLYPKDKSQRRVAAKALDNLVRRSRFHISTGFAGTPVISHALTAIGRSQLAYRMLLETKCPSWLYPVVSMGATTIWERWNSMLEDGSINPGQMTSFNHYALGAVADWLHTSVGGIAPLEPGWRVIRVRPVPGGNLTRSKVTFDGPYGLVSCEWTLSEGNQFRLTLVVPPNCSAVVTLPSELKNVFEMDDEETRVVQSGLHKFECEFNAGEWPPKPLIAANQPMPPDSVAI